MLMPPALSGRWLGRDRLAQAREHGSRSARGGGGLKSANHLRVAAEDLVDLLANHVVDVKCAG